MIRIRTAANKIVNLDHRSRFIEIMNDKGEATCIIHNQPNGQITIMTPGSDIFDKQCELYGMTSAAPLIKAGETR